MEKIKVTIVSQQEIPKPYYEGVELVGFWKEADCFIFQDREDGPSFFRGPVLITRSFLKEIIEEVEKQL